jgi:hypothetical protein
LVRNVAKVGINAELSTPPASNVKSVSDTRLAAKKADNSALAPKVRATRMLRSNPINWLMMNATITVPAARAICLFALLVLSFMKVDYTPTMTFRNLPELEAV